MRKLKLLMAACALMLSATTSWAQPTASTPVVGNTYYLYNPTTKLFMTTNVGLPFVRPTGSAWKLENGAKDGYITLRLKDNTTDGCGYFWGKWWANDPAGNSNDYSGEREFKLVNTSGANYKLQSYAWGSTTAFIYINNGNENDRSYRLACNSQDQAGLDVGLTIWQFVSEEDYDTYMSDDYTSRIANNDFLSGTANWTLEGSGNKQAHGNTAIEYWNGSAKDGKFDYYQNITVPAGKYVLRAAMYNSTNSEPEASFDEAGQCGVYGTSGGTTKNANVTVDGTGYNIYTTDGLLVADGKLRLGFKNSTTMTARWFGVDWIQLTCVDYYISALATEAFTSGSTMTAGQWYTFTVPTDGDYLFSVTDGIVYSLTDELNSTSFSTVSSTTALPAGTTIYLKSATSQPLTITYVEPVVANGDYYLYDATNKVFLSRGANYGSRAVVDKYGLPFTWNNYTKMIEFKDWPGQNMFFDNDNHTGCWLYTDGGSDRGDNRLFAFEEASTGSYYLCDKAKGAYITHDNSVLTVPSGTSSGAAVWQVLSKAQRDDIVNAYPTTNKSNVITASGISTTAAEFETYLAANYAAKDKTSLVGTVRFTKDGGEGDWTWTKVTGDDATYGDDWTEGYQNSGTWSQTINGLVPGIYKVTVNGFERKADYALCNTLGADGYEPVTAYFKANNEQLPLKSWYSEREETNNPNTTSQAATAFNNDKYKNTIYTYVENEGEGTGSLTLTIGKQDKASGSWVLFNNVTLTYYDSNVSSEEETAILTEATTEMAKPMKASLYQALASAKTAFESSKTVPNYNALRTAIDNTSTSIASYAAMKTNYLDKMDALLASTNVFSTTTEEYTAYVGYKDAYENYTVDGTADVENATANSLKAYDGDKGTRPVDKLLMSSWTIGGEATGNKFYQNTWSTEGASDGTGFLLPFYEYWTGDANVLAATTLQTTQTGLVPNGFYDVSVWLRVRQSNAGDKIDNAVTLKVGNGNSVDVSAGTKIGDTKLFIGNYTARGKADSEGKLTIAIEVAENSNVSWLAFRDLNYAAATYETVSISAAGYATYCSTNALDFSGTGIKAYTATVSSKTVTFHEVEGGKIAGSNGLLLKGAEGIYQVPVTVSTNNPSNDLAGVLVDTEEAAGIFVLMNGANGVGFYKTKNAFTVRENSAYLPASAGSRMFIGFDDEEEVTGIRELNSSANKGAIYNMNGVRVEKAKKGLYIQNGKKIVVK